LGRPWKDNFKSDFRLDQDHLLEKGSQIRSYWGRCRTQKRTVAFVMKHKQHNDPQFADCCSAVLAKMILDQIKRSPLIKLSYKIQDHDIFDS
jgi:hypothetical protein